MANKSFTLAQFRAWGKQGGLKSTRKLTTEESKRMLQIREANRVKLIQACKTAWRCVCGDLECQVPYSQMRLLEKSGYIKILSGDATEYCYQMTDRGESVAKRKAQTTVDTIMGL